jgi:hypothetical protein
MLSTTRRTISILLVVLFSSMTLAMVFTCPGLTTAHDVMDATECHHRSAPSIPPFSCCLAAVLPVEMGKLPGLAFIAFSDTPVLLKPLPFAFPFFIPPRSTVS